MCFSTSLEVGREYILVADYYQHGGYLPVDTEIVASTENVRNVSSVCRLNVQYPHGRSCQHVYGCQCILL